MEPWIQYRDRPSTLRRLVVWSLVVLVGGAAWWGVRSGPDDRGPFEIAVDDIVERAMDEGPIAGASVVVVRGWRVLHAKGYGFADVENEVSVTPETVFKVGSITKQFTAAAIMQLVEDGAIDLDASVTEYLPDRGLDHLSRVTVRHLLNHTAGVRDYTMIEESWRVLGIDMTPTQVLGYFDDEPLEFAPGSRFSYSNSGYVLLGMVVEAVTARPYGGYLNAEIFVPMGLERSAYCDDRRLMPNRAFGYDVEADGFLHARRVSMSQVYSAGAVCSSALDLVRWIRVLSRGEVVDRSSWEEMIAPGQLADGGTIEYGFGLAVGYVEGHHRVSHVGGFLGFMGQLAHYRDDDVTIVVLTNTEGAAAAQIESAIARLVLELGEVETLDLAIDTESLALFAGTYDVGPTTVDIVVVDGGLYADVRVPRLAGRYRLVYQGDDIFAAEQDGEVRLAFERADDGGVTGFTLRNRGIVMEAVRLGR